MFINCMEHLMRKRRALLQSKRLKLHICIHKCTLFELIEITLKQRGKGKSVEININNCGTC